MRPDATAINILSTTRATAKMREFRVAPEDFIALPRDPAVLFALAVGLLGDVAATLAVGVDGDTAPVDALPIPPSWGATGPAPIDGLRFASVFFDAFLDSQLDETITTEFSLLCASAYYLAGNIGSASVIVRRMEPPELGLAGGLGRLLHVILGNVFVPIEGDHVHAGHTTAILTVLRGYMRFDNDAIAVREAYTALRSAAYANGSPRELIYADLTSAVCATKLRHAARTVLSATSDLDAEVWRPALAKPHFPVEFWPAQQRIADAGLLRGLSAVIQMPTSAGKTRATELIIRSAFLAERASLAIIVAPYRSLCHDIRGNLSAAFTGEPINLDEASDSYQFDLELEALLANNTVLIVTPEKLLYMVRRAPELADRIGLVIYDEGHQFDGMARGPTYELLLTSLKMALTPATQIILISAVIGNAAEVASWLIGDPEAVVGGEGLLPTAKSIAFASWRGARGWLQYVSQWTQRSLSFGCRASFPISSCRYAARRQRRGVSRKRRMAATSACSSDFASSRMAASPSFAGARTALPSCVAGSSTSSIVACPILSRSPCRMLQRSGKSTISQKRISVQKPAPARRQQSASSRIMLTHHAVSVSRLNMQ
jgi:hypothetical protein